MEWFYLLVGVVISTAANFLLKASEGMSNIPYALGSFILFGVAIYLYGLSIRALPLSIAYIVWTGVGATAVVLLSVLFLGEKISILSFLFIVMIIIGTIGLHFVTRT